LDADAEQSVPEARERLRSSIDRVTIERNARRITLPDAFEPGGGMENNVLVLPRTPPSPHRRQEIIHGPSVPISAAATKRPARADRVAARKTRNERSVGMTLSLAFLAPDPVEAAIHCSLARG